jgi:hypothetical protein
VKRWGELCAGIRINSWAALTNLLLKFGNAFGELISFVWHISNCFRGKQHVSPRRKG